MTAQDLTRVPGREHYSLTYLLDGRLYSYAHQLHATLEAAPRSILEIGPGPGMVTQALRALGIEVTTVDIQPRLAPDVVASVTDLPFENDAFDTAMCCQVLEHLPFDQIELALGELARVSSRRVVLSLPDATPYYTIRLKLPKLGWLARWEGTRRKPPTEAYKAGRLESAGHAWEIGYEGHSLDDIERKVVASGLRIARTWRVPEKHWHRFFVLERSG